MSEILHDKFYACFFFWLLVLYHIVVETILNKKIKNKYTSQKYFLDYMGHWSSYGFAGLRACVMQNLLTFSYSFLESLQSVGFNQTWQKAYFLLDITKSTSVSILLGHALS